MRTISRLALVVLVLIAACVGALVGSGSAATSDDISLGINLGEPNGSPIPGTTADGLNFILFFNVATTTGLIQPVTLTVGLPAGLHWGAVAPTPSDGCQGTAPAVCTASTAANGAGTVAVGWGWDVVADAAGSYSVSATVVPTDPDPNTANNSATFRFRVVVPATTPHIAVTRPTVREAGSIVTASVHVSANGTPANPTAARCTGAIGATKLRGKAHLASGLVSCRYPAPRSAIGRILRGAVTVTVDTATLTRRFAIKLH